MRLAHGARPQRQLPGLLLVLGSAIPVLGWLIVRGVIRQLGGEPRYALQFVAAIVQLTGEGWG